MRHRSSPSSVPKVCGADIELGNFVRGQRSDSKYGTGALAASYLIREIDGVKTGVQRMPRSYLQRGVDAKGEFDPQDWGRRFLPSNGGCVYVDLGHLELCVPETASAYDHVACWHAMLRIARDALEAANSRLDDDRQIEVLVNNSDGLGNSYGSHLSFLITRRAWNNLFRRKLHQLSYFATYLASSILFTGAGKVGSENQRPRVDFQISQRADFFEVLTAKRTTFERPLVNARDESLAQPETLARLHVIAMDSTLSHVATLLKVGVTQIVLAMIETETFDPTLLLDDPVDAIQGFSSDPTLARTARLVDGRRYRALDLQWRLFELAASYVASGRCEGIVPRAGEILLIWEDTLKRLEGDLDSLASRLDWVLKRSILEQAREELDLAWDAPELKHLDLVYHSLSREGIYWANERTGAVERVATPECVARFVVEPPSDTRAWLRAQLLRRFGDQVRSVDWHRIRFGQHRGFLPAEPRHLSMDDPTDMNEAATADFLEGEPQLDRLLAVLDQYRRETRGSPSVVS